MKKFWFLILIFLLLPYPSSVVASQCYGCDLWDKATEYVKAGDHYAAIDALKEAIDWADKDGETAEAKAAAWQYIGQIYEFHLEDYGNAIRAYQSAASLEPSNGERWSDLGEAQYQYALKEAESISGSSDPDDSSEVAALFGNAINSLNLAQLKGENMREMIDEAKDKQQSLLKPASGSQGSSGSETSAVSKPVQTITPSETASLKPASAVISVISEPSGASIQFDGTEIGVTPYTITSVSEGEHKVILSLDGYSDYSYSVTGTPGVTYEVPVTLVPNTQENPSDMPSSQSGSDEVADKECMGEDLVVTDLNVMYKEKTKELVVDTTIKNEGSHGASNFGISYLLTQEKTDHPFIDLSKKEYLLYRDDISRLDAGKDRSGKELKVLTITNDIPAGTYWFGVYVDSGNTVPETDESNNVVYWGDEIKVSW